MGLTRADLIGEMSDEERASRQAWIDRTSSNDQWAKKIFEKVGILITGHQANRPYMKACIDSHAALGLWITLAYDNFVLGSLENSLASNVKAVQANGTACEYSYQAILSYKKENHIALNGNGDPCQVFLGPRQ